MTSPTGSVDGLLDAIKSVITDNTSTAYDDQDDSFTAIDDYSGLINDLEQLILAREERFHDAFQRGERKGRRFEEFLEGAEWMKSREQMIEMLCLLRWHRSFNEVKSFPNDRALSEISDFMKLMDAIVDKEVTEKLQSLPNTTKEG